MLYAGCLIDPKENPAIECAPSIVREYGLREAHSCPLVGCRTPYGEFWSGREPANSAWWYPYIQTGSSATAFTALVFDCDNPDESQYALVDRLPKPNWIVVNPVSGNFHVTYALSCPVHKYPKASEKPIRWLRHISEYYRDALSADPGYAGVLTRNPAPLIATGDKTEWHRRDPYELRELDDVIPQSWTPPRISTTGVGRNVNLFTDVMKWAGSKENISIPVLTEATQRNRKFDVPLPDSEVRRTARKISEYRDHWVTHGWHSDKWIYRQAARGRRSGQARRNRTRKRDVEIVAALASGMSVSEAARRWKLSRKAIRKIRNR